MQKIKVNQPPMLRPKKMPMIGQLVAGAAYETMTPMGDLSRNLSTLRKYMQRVNRYVDACDRHLGQHNSAIEQSFGDVSTVRRNLKIEYVLQELIDLIDESIEGADRIKATVKNLKALSRTNKEQPDLANLNNCLDATLNILWCEIKEQKTVVKEYGDIPLISCYPQQIGHVFSHLLLNAIQAIDDNGILHLSTRVENDCVVVEIRDNGHGIAPDHLPRIFDPFFTTRRVTGGAGFGLNVSREIVEKHGGEIIVTSNVGRGTVCQVVLPINRKH
jgi:two-component system NtrC family sensor kinase